MILIPSLTLLIFFMARSGYPTVSLTHLEQPPVKVKLKQNKNFKKHQGQKTAPILMHPTALNLIQKTSSPPNHIQPFASTSRLKNDKWRADTKCIHQPKRATPTHHPHKLNTLTLNSIPTSNHPLLQYIPTMAKASTRSTKSTLNTASKGPEKVKLTVLKQPARKKKTSPATLTLPAVDPEEEAFVLEEKEVAPEENNPVDSNKDDDLAAKEHSPPKRQVKKFDGEKGEVEVPSPDNTAKSSDASMDGLDDTNNLINTINNPNDDDSMIISSPVKSPSKSPLKKKSKREALAGLITRPLKTPEPEPTNEENEPSNVETAAASNAGGKGEKRTANEATKTTSKPKKAEPKSKAKPSDDATLNPPSALKEGKYGKTIGFDGKVKVLEQPHDHRHKRTVIEGSIDFSKAALAHLDDNGQKMHFAISELQKDINFSDPVANICHRDILSTIHIGPGGVKTPSNMTRLSCYMLNMNLNQFKAVDNGGGDALDSISGKKKAGGRGRSMYFTFYLSSDVEPRKIVDMVGFEWCKFGVFLRVKELQATDTSTSLVLWNVCSMIQRATIQEEFSLCLKMIRNDMDFSIDDDEVDYDVDWATAAVPPPKVNLRSNVPNIPKSKTQSNKLPKHLLSFRRAFHVEVSVEDEARLKSLVKYGKKKGHFKEILGPHSHVTEVVNWESPASDLKRADGFFRDFINYNASMTITDVEGLLDLNRRIAIKDERGRAVQYVSGRFCLLSLLKLSNGSSAVAEVHQICPNDVVSIVHPNIPEAEKIMCGLRKHPAGFLHYLLKDCGVDEVFVEDLLKEYVDPSLVHEIPHCKWNSKDQTIMTPEELEEEDTSDKLVNQSWFKDIVQQYEEQKESSKKSKNYASAAALYDLDATKSVKTMHAANDGEENAEELVEVIEDGEGKSTGDMSSLGDDGSVVVVEAETTERLRKESTGAEAAIDFQSGHTPKSVERRSEGETHDGAEANSDDESSAAESYTAFATATASAAGSHGSPEAGKAG